MRLNLIFNSVNGFLYIGRFIYVNVLTKINTNKYNYVVTKKSNIVFINTFIQSYNDLDYKVRWL